MERKEDKEKVLVPVRRRGPAQEEELQQELPKEPDEVKVPRMPRRWYVYY